MTAAGLDFDPMQPEHCINMLWECKKRDLYGVPKFALLNTL